MGLTMLFDGIANEAHVETRYAILSRNFQRLETIGEHAKKTLKTSVAIAVPNLPGAIYRVV